MHSIKIKVYEAPLFYLLKNFFIAKKEDGAFYLENNEIHTWIIILLTYAPHNESLKCERLKMQKDRRRPDTCHPFHPEVFSHSLMFLILCFVFISSTCALLGELDGVWRSCDTHLKSCLHTAFLTYCCFYQVTTTALCFSVHILSWILACKTNATIQQNNTFDPILKMMPNFNPPPTGSLTLSSHSKMMNRYELLSGNL